MVASWMGVRSTCYVKSMCGRGVLRVCCVGIIYEVQCGMCGVRCQGFMQLEVILEL